MKSVRTASTICVFACTLLMVGAAVRADEAAVKKSLQAVYDKISAAMKRKDVDAISATATKDFVSKSGNRTMNAKQSLDMIKATLASMQKVQSVSQSVVSLKMTGAASAEAISTSRLMAVIVGKDHKQHQFIAEGKSKDEWVKTPKGWLLKSVEDLPGSKMTLDSKPMSTSGQ